MACGLLRYGVTDSGSGRLDWAGLSLAYILYHLLAGKIRHCEKITDFLVIPAIAR
ncbi:MAG: hypothetical protein P8X74_10345 [Reinekea sp.]